MVEVVAGGPGAAERAAAALRAGGLVALPTETVYGLGADASDADAVRRVFAVKGRPADHPLIVHLADADELDRWAARVPPEARELADACWPGPLTLLLERHPRVLDVVTGGLPTVGLRVPAQGLTLAVLRSFGGGVAAPSANRFGRVSPTTAADVVEDLGPWMDPARDLVLDGGPCPVGVESTILDLTVDPPVVLRPGGLPAEDLERVLGRPVQRRATGPSRAPGMLAAHYAPSAAVEVSAAATVGDRAAALAAAGRPVAVLAPSGTALPPAAAVLPAPDPYDDAALARCLYARLRDADRLGVEVLLVVPPAGERGLAPAVLDRLSRAAASGAASGGASGGAP